MTLEDPDLDCGAFQWQLTMQDGSDIDETLFTLDDALNPQSISAYTEDAQKLGIY